jgi:hypothetical protein
MMVYEYTRTKHTEKMRWWKSQNSIQILRFCVVSSLIGQLDLNCNVAYGDNGDVIEVPYVELYGVMGRRLHWASRANIVPMKYKNWETLPKNIDQESFRVKKLQVQHNQIFLILVWSRERTAPKLAK